MSLNFAVVYEAEADFHTATDLADRVLLETIDWLEEDLLPFQRTWLSHSTGGELLTWKRIKQLALDAGVVVVGHFDDQPALPDAKAARRAIIYLMEEYPDLDAILLIRDRDDQPERRGGVEQARNEDSGDVKIIIGLAIVERESWVISGFDPQDDEEMSRLEAERKTLGFDPRHRSHELTACKDDTASRSPKRVLRHLSEDDRDRERHCWLGASLEILRERGGENGLAAYLSEVRNRLAPLIGHVDED